MESRDVAWMRHMHYPQLYTDDTELNPLVVIKEDCPRDEAAEQCVKIEEVKADDKDNASVRSEVSRASLSLEQEICRSSRVYTSDHK